MPGSDALLDKPSAELTELLLRVARADAAPREARERALQNVAAAALGLGVLSGTAVLGSRASLLKGKSWLVAKWLAAGMSTGLLGLTVAQGVVQLVAEPAAPPALSTATSTPARANPHSVPLAPESAAPLVVAQLSPATPAATPAQSVASSARAPSSAPALAMAPVAPIDREPKSPSPTSSARTEATSALANSKSSLTRELTLLEQARSALAQRAAGGALQALDQYRSEFPRGALQVEAAALRVEAVGQSGDRALAQRLALAFLANFPTSARCARVRAYSEVFVGDAQKP